MSRLFYKIEVPEKHMTANQNVLANDSRFGTWRNCLHGDYLSLHQLAGRIKNWLDAPMPTENELGFGLLRLVQEGLVGMTEGNQPVTVRFIRTTAEAKAPTFAKTGDACADVYAVSNIEGIKNNGDNVWRIQPGAIVAIDTGLRVEIPYGWEIEVRPRSGLSTRGITVVNSPGTIDSGYRGDCKVLLINHGKEEFVVKPGDRIAQFAVRKAPTVQFVEVEELSASDRGTGGFGSTGR